MNEKMDIGVCSQLNEYIHIMQAVVATAALSIGRSTLSTDSWIIPGTLYRAIPQNKCT